MNNHISDIEEELYSYDDTQEQLYSPLYKIYKNSNPYFSKLMNLFILLFYFLESILYSDNNEDVSSLTENLYFRVIEKYPYCQDNRYQLWRFITSSFLHLNLKHLFSNILILFPLTYYFEIFYDFRNLIIILLLTSFTSNLIFYYYQPYTAIIGCSHLVFGLFGSLLSDYIVNKKYNDSFYILQLIMCLLPIVIDVSFYYLNRNENSGYIAHWGGYLTGFIIGLIFLYNFINKKYNNKIRYLLSLIFLYIISYLSYNYIFNWPPKIDDNCCYLLLTNQTVYNCLK